MWKDTSRTNLILPRRGRLALVWWTGGLILAAVAVALALLAAWRQLRS